MATKSRKKSKKTKRTANFNFYFYLFTGLASLLVMATGITIKLNSKDNEVILSSPAAQINYSEEEVPALVEESGKGAITTEDIPTVEAVVSNGPVTITEEEACPSEEECGKGAIYPELDISSPSSFRDAVIGKCLDVDGYFGAQCYDSMAAYFYNYAKRTLNTCGTGAAKGTIADGCWQKNAGNEFTMIWDAHDIEPGDIAVYSSGEWGHIGMAMGYYNNGYFTLLGQNQGGNPCPNGGSSGNIINLSTRDFIGAFRPNIYIKKEEPKVEPPLIPSCKQWNVKTGDTLGYIMQSCTGKLEWGEKMNEYAKKWRSIKFKLTPTVYDGWASPNGVGLFAGDVIEYRGE